MTPRTQHRLGGLLVCGLVTVLTAACSVSESSQTSDHVQANLARTDKVWFPDLNADSEPDVMILTGQEVRFAVARDGDYLDVVEDDGDPLAVRVGDGVTVTCQPEGAFVQTFEPPSDDAATGPLRLYHLDIDGSQGELIPSPSLFFGPDFELPDLGAGCPTSR